MFIVPDVPAWLLNIEHIEHWVKLAIQTLRYGWQAACYIRRAIRAIWQAIVEVIVKAISRPVEAVAAMFAQLVNAAFQVVFETISEAISRLVKRVLIVGLPVLLLTGFVIACRKSALAAIKIA